MLNYANGLHLAIERDDLVTMRRHGRADFYLESFQSCAGRVRLALEDEVPNLFELAAEEEDAGMVMH